MGPIQDMHAIDIFMYFRAQAHARAAADAQIFGEGKKRLDRDAFRIVTPDALQRTAFEKNGGADAGPIVYGKRLKPEDIASDC